MAGGASTDRPKPAATARKSRWEPPSSSATAAADPKLQPPKPNPKPKSSPNPAPSPKPTPPAGPPNPHPHHPHHPPPPAPPQPTYGFHMLERRTIALADGSVRTYHALPPDYQDFPPPPQRLFPPPGPVPGRHGDYWNSLGLDPGKRKFHNEDDRYGHPSGEESSSRAPKLMRPTINGGDRRGPPVVTKHSEVDSDELKKAFLRFVKAVNETTGQRRSYLENRSYMDNGKYGRLHCPACPATERSSKDFADTHSLILHSYNWDNADLRVDHLGLHKALCALLGWDYSIPPDNSKTYQNLSADEAAANQDDLIMWPPMVIIHNTITGKNKDGRMEGFGNKYMDARIKDLGFSGGKSKSLYGREGHLGMTLIKFSGDQAGLKEAMRLADYFERDNRGRRAWFRLQPLTIGGPDDENNPHLMNSDERSRDKKRILYGYVGTSRDIDRIDFETRKKVTFECLREYGPS